MFGYVNIKLSAHIQSVKRTAESVQNRER